MRKTSLLVVFLTVFIDLIGFGIVLPLLPIFSEDFGASPWVNGCIMAVYSLMQFIFAPFWGRLSDRIGRRPVLLVSTAAAAIAYSIFAYGSSLQGGTALLVLFLSRALAGVCAANITVAQAYIADITPPENRSRRMGLIGMAFGLGFIVGPAIGGFSRDWFGMSGPGWVAAGFCAFNFFLTLAVLGESWKPDRNRPPVHRPGFKQWSHTLSQPRIGTLVGIFFLATFCFTCFETTLGMLLKRNFNLDLDKDAKTIGLLFAYCGIIGAAVQGGAIGRLVKLMGEPRLIATSLVLLSISLALLPFAHSWSTLLPILALLSIGSSLTRPPVFGLISNLTSAHEQGANIGVAQGGGSLARILGPLCAIPLLSWMAPAPYLLCAAVSLAAAFWAIASLCRTAPSPSTAPTPENSPTTP